VAATLPASSPALAPLQSGSLLEDPFIAGSMHSAAPSPTASASASASASAAAQLADPFAAPAPDFEGGSVAGRSNELAGTASAGEPAGVGSSHEASAVPSRPRSPSRFGLPGFGLSAPQPSVPSSGKDGAGISRFGEKAAPENASKQNLTETLSTNMLFDAMYPESREGAGSERDSSARSGLGSVHSGSTGGGPGLEVHWEPAPVYLAPVPAALRLATRPRPHEAVLTPPPSDAIFGGQLAEARPSLFQVRQPRQELRTHCWTTLQQSWSTHAPLPEFTKDPFMAVPSPSQASPPTLDENVAPEDLLPHLAGRFAARELRMRWTTARQQFDWADTSGDGLIESIEAVQLCRDNRYAAGGDALPFGAVAQWLPRFTFRPDSKITFEDFLCFASLVDLLVPDPSHFLHLPPVVASVPSPPFEFAELPERLKPWGPAALLRGPSGLALTLGLQGSCLQVSKHKLSVPEGFARGELTRLLQLPAHPCVVNEFLAVHEDDTSFYLIQECKLSSFGATDGSNLDLLEWMSEARVAVPVAALWWITQVVGQLLDGVEHLHANHVLHLGICPSSILLSANFVPTPLALPSRVVLTDSGLGGLFHTISSADLADGLSQQDVVLATSLLSPVGQCAAPESLAGMPGASSDLFSIGCVLHLLLLGQLPPQHEAAVASGMSRWDVLGAAQAQAALPELATLSDSLREWRAADRPSVGSVRWRLGQVAAALRLGTGGWPLLEAATATTATATTAPTSSEAAPTSSAPKSSEAATATTAPSVDVDLPALWRAFGVRELERRRALLRLAQRLTVGQTRTAAGLEVQLPSESLQQPASEESVAALLQLVFDAEGRLGAAAWRELLPSLSPAPARSSPALPLSCGALVVQCLQATREARAFAAGAFRARAGALRALAWRPGGIHKAVSAASELAVPTLASPGSSSPAPQQAESVDNSALACRWSRSEVPLHAASMQGLSDKPSAS